MSIAWSLSGQLGVNRLDVSRQNIPVGLFVMTSSHCILTVHVHMRIFPLIILKVSTRYCKSLVAKHIRIFSLELRGKAKISIIPMKGGGESF